MSPARFIAPVFEHASATPPAPQLQEYCRDCGAAAYRDVLSLLQCTTPECIANARPVAQLRTVRDV